MESTISLIAWLIFILLGFLLSALAYVTILIPRAFRPATNQHRHQRPSPKSTNVADEEHNYYHDSTEPHPMELCSYMHNSVHYLIFLFVLWLSIVGICVFISYGISETDKGLLVSNEKWMNNSYTVGVFFYIFSQVSFFFYLVLFYHPAVVGNRLWSAGISIIPVVLSFILALVSFICFWLILSWKGISNHFLNSYYLWWIPILTYIPWLFYLVAISFKTIMFCINGNHFGKIPIPSE